MNLKACGLLETPYNFFIDHLAPICSFLQIPLISSHPQTKLLYQKYYPHLEIKLKNWTMNSLMQEYDRIYYSFVPSPTFKQIIQALQKKEPKNPLWRKKVEFIYHFHGCSDKGFHSTWVDPNGHFSEVDEVLLYGDRMKDLLEHKKLLHLPKKYTFVGNYRKQYYEKHQAFFDEKVEKDIFSKFKENKPILLYAPTWQDAENSSSFFQITESLTQKLSSDFNLLIKLHPNMTLERPGYNPKPVLALLDKVLKTPNTLILPFYPLIYPLLKRCNLFLGDYSSVGYDALSYPKPLFFLNSNDRDLNDPGALLFSCGHVLSKKDYPFLDRIIIKGYSNFEQELIERQKKLYRYAFKAGPSFKASSTFK